MNWFTSDEHLNHFAIIDHTNRPFFRWQDMNDEIIKRHNSRVHDSDTVYHLGDFKFSSVGPNVYELIKQLNGKHVFVRGNHDKNNGLNTILEYCIIKTYGRLILLTNKPENALMYMSMGGIDLAFVGHVHHNWKFKENMINVGVDMWDFYPVGAKQILKAYDSWKEGK